MKNFRFEAKLWKYPGEQGAWFFISVPKAESAVIKKLTANNRRGWGAVRVKVKVGKTIWETSIFPDSKAGTYLLPVKAKIRRLEGLFEGESAKVLLTLVRWP